MNDVEVVKGIAGAEIVTTPAGVGAIEMNINIPELSDKRVRQAFAYAIDKKTICTSLFQGYADPVSTEIPYVKWAQPADANPYDFDPDKAKSLLKDAGWTGDKTLTLWYYYPDQVTATVMEAIQQYLAAVGIKVELRFDDGSGVRTQQVKDGTWELTYGSFGAQPAPSSLSVVWGPPGRQKLHLFERRLQHRDGFGAENLRSKRTGDVLPAGHQDPQRGFAVGLAVQPQEPDRGQHRQAHHRHDPGLGPGQHHVREPRPGLDGRQLIARRDERFLSPGAGRILRRQPSCSPLPELGEGLGGEGFFGSPYNYGRLLARYLLALG